jgi:D-tyrosyl-tRNA(Tyr) deacylase
VRAVVQRVSNARVRVGERITGEIGLGLLAYVGVGTDDDESDAAALAAKIVELRIFPDDAGLMNCSLLESCGSLLLVSQFTLQGDVRRGRRPSFIMAAKEPPARGLFERVGTVAESLGATVAYGEFGAHMTVDSVNDGPVTILIDTKRTF